MAKKRSQSGPGQREQVSRTEDHATERTSADRDPALVEQGSLGNAELQARIHAGEIDLAALGPVEGAGEDLEAARPLVERARLALQVDPADPERLARLTGILARSALPDREALVDRLQAAEALRDTLDGALDAHFGGHDLETRWAVDAALTAVAEALQTGRVEEGRFVDAQGAVALTAVGEGGDRAASLVADVASARAPAEAAERAGGDVGAAVRGVVRSLALALLLEDDEEEEEGWFEPDLALD